MPAKRKPPPSPIKTAVTHTAIAVLTFASLGSIGVYAMQKTGDPELSSPKKVVGLFIPPTHEPVGLKDRIDDSHGHGNEPDAHSEADPDHEAPNLGVADLDDHSGHNSSQSNSHDDSHDEPSDDHAGVQLASAHSGANSLPKAPLPGMAEWGNQGQLPIVAEDGRTSFQVYRRPFSNPAGRPAISVVVGGLGLNSKVTDAAIAELPPEVTLSFVPYARGLQGWVDKARAAGHEVMIEMPMEPYDYPNNDTGPYTLLTTATAQENLRRTEWLLSRATGFFGVTNYQGAKFATDSRAINPVFEELSERGLAFIHDGSAPRSVFETSAKSATLPFAEAARVIDSEPSAGAIDEQLLHLEAIALQRGSALGTGFAFPITIDQLSDWASTLSSKGYVLAPASALPRSAAAYNVGGR